MISAQQADEQLTRILAHLEGKYGRAIAQTTGHEMLPRYEGGTQVLHERRDLTFRDGARAILTRPPGGPWTSEAGRAAEAGGAAVE